LPENAGPAKTLEDSATVARRVMSDFMVVEEG
jgi:hypothetical protein